MEISEIMLGDSRLDRIFYIVHTTQYYMYFSVLCRGVVILDIFISSFTLQKALRFLFQIRHSSIKVEKAKEETCETVEAN